MTEPRKGDLSVLARDGGPVLFPKLFRRQCNWAVRKKAGIVKTGFQKFMETVNDNCFETAEFLEKGVFSATQYRFADFIKGGKTVAFDAAGLVFQEAASQLLGPDGKAVSAF